MPQRQQADSPAAPRSGVIELRLHDSAQLFNTLDPFPFRERDLSAEAERFIVEWAQELPKDSSIEILVHLRAVKDAIQTSDLAEAITGWFEARRQAETRALRELFRDGRVGFLIGIGVLSFCLLLSWSLSQRFQEPFARVISESFVIIGWVVIWRPAEIFLYDWLPLVRRRKLYHRLAEAVVTVRSADDGSDPSEQDATTSRHRQHIG
ncbi:MAG TPA: hypothetical protein VGN91_02280 [Bosea sp. (in: a-proteobacteria)]|jgi:hypothetical protein|nr:hypothetical protein [Bosea sp. (in: a-proteobacteria)]